MSEFGISHPEAGASLAQSWGFPASLQAGILHHHHHTDTVESIACTMAQYAGFFAVQYRDETPIESWAATLPRPITTWVNERFPGISRTIRERIDTI
jgi:hypothetical protein